MGYAPINGLKMYYEVHGSGDPVVLLHGSFMTITNNWTGWIGELSKTRKVIAVEIHSLAWVGVASYNHTHKTTPAVTIPPPGSPGSKDCPQPCMRKMAVLSE
jgi:hypothetical protein